MEIQIKTIHSQNQYFVVSKWVKRVFFSSISYSFDRRGFHEPGYNKPLRDTIVDSITKGVEQTIKHEY